MCEYCFVKRFKDIKDIKPIRNSYNSLKGFIEGKRQSDTKWCDWNIPVHWGGMSDPFQPIEKQKNSTMEELMYEECTLKRTQQALGKI